MNKDKRKGYLSPAERRKPENTIEYHEHLQEVRGWVQKYLDILQNGPYLADIDAIFQMQKNIRLSFWLLLITSAPIILSSLSIITETLLTGSSEPVKGLEFTIALGIYLVAFLATLNINLYREHTMTNECQTLLEDLDKINSISIWAYTRAGDKYYFDLFQTIRDEISTIRNLSHSIRKNEDTLAPLDDLDTYTDDSQTDGNLVEVSKRRQDYVKK